MCGVFGFVSHDGLPVDLEILERIAVVTMRRGPHAWGMAWIDGHGRLKMFKQTGRITSALGLLSMASDARALIGHCRYATHGDPSNNLNNHPHPADGGWIVHNGVIGNYEDIIDAEDLHPVTECDSEVLGLLYQQTTGDAVSRVRSVMRSTASNPVVMLGLWKPGRIVVARRNNPLHYGTAKRWTYFGSLPDGLPGKVMEFPEGEVGAIVAGKGAGKLIGSPILPARRPAAPAKPCMDTLWSRVVKSESRPRCGAAVGSETKDSLSVRIGRSRPRF